VTDRDVTLADVHRMLELVAFLLAVLLVQSGGYLGVVFGGGVVLFFVFDNLWRFTERISN
jgi:hypothetical protein